MQTFRRRTSPHTNRGGSTKAGLTNGKGKSNSWDYLIPVLVGVLCAAALIVVYLAVFSGSSHEHTNDKLVGNLEEAREDPSGLRDFESAKDRIRAMKDGKSPFMDKGGLFGGQNFRNFQPNQGGDANGNAAGGGGGDANGMPNIGNFGGMNGMFNRKGMKPNLADISPEDMKQYEKYAEKMKKLNPDMVKGNFGGFGNGNNFPRGGPDFGRPNREQMEQMRGNNIDTNDIPRQIPRGGVDREYKEKWKRKYGDLARDGGIGDDKMREYRQQMKADRLQQRANGGAGGGRGDMSMEERIAEKERWRAERQRERAERGGDVGGAQRESRMRQRPRPGDPDVESGGNFSPEQMRQYREQMKADRIKQRFGDRFPDGQGAFGAFGGNHDADGNVVDRDAGGAGAGAGAAGGRPRGGFGGLGGNLGAGGLGGFAGFDRGAAGGRGGAGGGDADFANFREQLRNGMLNDQDIDEIIQRKKDRLRQRYNDDGNAGQ